MHISGLVVLGVIFVILKLTGIIEDALGVRAIAVLDRTGHALGVLCLCHDIPQRWRCFMSDTCKITKIGDLDGAINPRTTFHLQHPLPQIFESNNLSSRRVRYALSLPIEDRPQGVGNQLSLLAERQDLLAMARHIVHALEPLPQDQALDELKEIRELLEKRG